VRSLSDVFARRFGDTAILTGVLNSKSVEDNSSKAKTVVFTRNAGKWKIASAQWTTVKADK
jgi:ketosteroid isomerase-like protein